MPSTGSLKKFESIMAFAAIGFPLFVANVRNFCPGSPGLLARIGAFPSLVDLGIATPEQVCLIEDFWIVYVLSALLGCYYFRVAIQEGIIKRRQAMGKSPDVNGARRAALVTVSLLTAVAVLMFLVSPTPSLTSALGAIDRISELKRFYGLQFLVAVDAMFFGYLLVTWRQLPGLASPTNGEDGR